MAQQTVVKRSAAAAVINTDTTIFTPAAGVKHKILAFQMVNEGAAQVAGIAFELRFGSNILALVGTETGTAPIGQTSKQQILAHEFVGDGVTAVVGRNLTALNTSATAGYVVTYDSNY